MTTWTRERPKDKMCVCNYRYIDRPAGWRVQGVYYPESKEDSMGNTIVDRWWHEVTADGNYPPVPVEIQNYATLEKKYNELLRTMINISVQDQGCGGNITKAEAWDTAQKMALDVIERLK